METKEQEELLHVLSCLARCLPDALGKTTEIEIRVGSLIEKSTNKRLDIGFMHPCVIERSDTLKFQASVEEKDFDRIESYYAKKGTPVCKTIVDTLLKGGRRSEVKEVNGKACSEAPVFIKKIKMKSVDIFCPANKYDVRISISEEILKEDTVSFPAPIGVRNKQRKTFNQETHFVELTKVRSESAYAKEKGQCDTTYEVEIEAVNSAYKKDEFIRTVATLISSVPEMTKRQKEDSSAAS